MTATTTQINSLLASQRLLSMMGRAGEYIWLLSKTKPLEDRLQYLAYAISQLKRRVSEGKDRYQEYPVDVITFIESPLLLGMGEEVYPGIKTEIANICSGRYMEAVFTGGIGSGKTTSALIVTAYGLYELSCMANPQKTFGLASSSEINFIFQSLNEKKAIDVEYVRFRNMLDASPYFKEVFPYNRELKSSLKFPNNINVKPVSGDPKATIGENIIGGIIDEVNFMATVEKSNKASDGGKFDQAQAIYSSIVRRRESRFMLGGHLFGMLCLVSSKRYPGEFTDQRMKSAKTDPRIYIYDKRVWEVKPDSYSGTWFHLFTGDVSNIPAVIPQDEVRDALEKHPDKVMKIPMEFLKAFEDNLLDAVRDIAGVSTLAMHPYMVHNDKVASCFGRKKSVLSRILCDMISTKVEFFLDRVVNPEEPRYAHIDLGLTGDSAGIAVGHVSRFVEIERFNTKEMMPELVYDFVLEVPPPKNGEIEFDGIRRLLYKVRELGLPIKWVSLDSYQSVDTMQILARHGFQTGKVSMDVTNLPYDLLKQALYDHRVVMHEHQKAQMELIRLEKDPKTGKIDHPSNFSKDCADAMAGVAYGLTMRRLIWVRHGITREQVPENLSRAMKDEKTEIAA